MNQSIDLSKVTTLIFDLGGVIIDLDRDACVRAYEKLGLENADALLDNYIPNGIFLQMERGELSAQEFRNEIRQLIKKEVSDEQINAAHMEFLLGIPQERKDMLRKLRKSYRILALSNTSPIHIEGFFKPTMTCDKYTIDDYFDKLYLSYEMKCHKPTTEIYEKLLQDAGLKGEECLFFDDGLKNIEVARTVGFQIYHVTPDNNWIEYMTSKI